MDVNQTYNIQIITDIPTCQQLWECLSPKETIYDDWHFREIFHSYYQHDLYFVAAYKDTTCVGLLPLQKNKQTEIYEAWCGDYMEDNRAMVHPDHTAVIPLLYAQVPAPAHIQYIRGNDEFTKQLPELEGKCILPLQGYTSATDYVEHIFHGDTKQKILKRTRKEAATITEIQKNNLEDIELLFSWNKQTFGEHSSFNDRPHHAEIFRDLLKPNPSYTVHLLTFCVGGVKMAVTFGILYNGVYASMNRGIHPEASKNLREFLQLQKVEDAIQLGAHTLDGFVGDYGWKERWGFQKIPQHVFKKDV